MIGNNVHLEAQIKGAQRSIGTHPDAGSVPTNMEVVLSDLADITNYARHAGERLKNILEKAYGAAPEPVNESARPEPVGVLAVVACRLETLQVTLGKVHERITKLETII
jgi:hypothetical protein